jgi:hypothetical protein
MRIRTAVTAVLLTAAAAAAVACARQVDLVPLVETPVPVSITARCSNNEVQVTVSPWRVVVPPNTPVEWTMSPSSNATSFTIENRTPGGRWPYTDAPPYGSANGKARPTGPMGVSPKGDYRYAIVTTCTEPGTNVSHYIVIDPDMILPN